MSLKQKWMDCGPWAQWPAGEVAVTEEAAGKAKGIQRQGRSQDSLMPLERLFLGHSAPSLVTWTSPKTAEEMERKKEERKGREGKDHKAIKVGRRTKQQLFPEFLRAKINGVRCWWHWALLCWNFILPPDPAANTADGIGTSRKSLELSSSGQARRGEALHRGWSLNVLSELFGDQFSTATSSLSKSINPAPALPQNILFPALVVWLFQTWLRTGIAWTGKGRTSQRWADTCKDWGDAMDQASAPSKEIPNILYSSPGNAPAEEEPSLQIFLFVLFLSISFLQPPFSVFLPP